VTKLDSNSGSISCIYDSFRHFVEDLQLWSFYETVSTNLKLTSAIIVDKVSVNLDYAKERTSLFKSNFVGQPWALWAPWAPWAKVRAQQVSGLATNNPGLPGPAINNFELSGLPGLHVYGPELIFIN